MSANWRRNGLVYLLILVAVVALFYSASQSADHPPEIDLTEVASLVQSGKVTAITVSGDVITLPTVFGIVNGHKYRGEVLFVCGAQTFEAYFEIQGCR